MELAKCTTHDTTHDRAWLGNNKPKALGCDLLCVSCEQPAYGVRPGVRVGTYRHKPGTAGCKLKTLHAEVTLGDHEVEASAAGVGGQRASRMVFSALDEAERHHELGLSVASTPGAAVNRYTSGAWTGRGTTFNLRQCLLHLIQDEGWLPELESIDVPDRAGPGQAGRVRPCDLFRTPEQITDKEIDAQGHHIVWFAIDTARFYTNPSNKKAFMYFNTAPIESVVSFSLRVPHTESEQVRSRKQAQLREQFGSHAPQWLFREAYAIAYGQLRRGKSARAEMHVENPLLVYFLSRG